MSRLKMKRKYAIVLQYSKLAGSDEGSVFRKSLNMDVKQKGWKWL